MPVSLIPAASAINGTLPVANGGTGLTSGGPAFSAYRSSTQSVTVNTYTKVQCNTEEFDTNSNYDNATNYRFTPTVSGIYQINGGVFASGTAMTAGIIKIYKNGTAYKQGSLANANGSANEAMVVNSIVYFNGSTDYVELYAFVAASADGNFSGNIDATWFNGCLIRTV
jgi:hypothetical protein